MYLARQRVANTAAAVQASEAFAHASTLAALAGAAVTCRALPPKLNGVVQVRVWVPDARTQSGLPCPIQM